ncbi:MAG: hypothetical protein LBT53_04645 [Puniceicoccales bacterium]|jgi:hypothetical protein|nr:hypothetical protein [Puniceicoccales bacterium]
MKTIQLIPQLIPLLAAASVLSACSTHEMDTSASNTGRVAAYPVTGPVRAVGDQMPVSETKEYVYWKKVPNTNNEYEKFVSPKPLTLEERRKEGLYIAPGEQ